MVFVASVKRSVTMPAELWARIDAYALSEVRGNVSRGLAILSDLGLRAYGGELSVRPFKAGESVPR